MAGFQPILVRDIQMPNHIGVWNRKKLVWQYMSCERFIDLRCEVAMHDLFAQSNQKDSNNG
jgi:hypothetical protein